MTINHAWLLQIGDPAGGNATRRSLTPGTASYSEAVISPDGETIAALRDGDLYLLPATGGSARRVTDLAAEITTLSWSPDGSHVAFKASVDDWRLMVVAATGSGAARRVGDFRISPNRWIPSDLGWSADGNHLYYMSYDSIESGWRTVDVISERDSTLLQDFPLMGPVPSPDGRWVAGIIEERIEAISLEDGTRRVITDQIGEHDAFGAILLHWSDQNVIYYAPITFDGVREVWTVSATGGPAIRHLEIPEGLLPNGTASHCESISMAEDTRRFVCSAPATYAEDIWIADNFDPWPM